MGVCLFVVVQVCRHRGWNSCWLLVIMIQRIWSCTVPSNVTVGCCRVLNLLVCHFDRDAAGVHAVVVWLWLSGNHCSDYSLSRLGLTRKNGNSHLVWFVRDIDDHSVDHLLQHSPKGWLVDREDAIKRLYCVRHPRWYGTTRAWYHYAWIPIGSSRVLITTTCWLVALMCNKCHWLSTTICQPTVKTASKLRWLLRALACWWIWFFIHLDRTQSLLSAIRCWFRSCVKWFRLCMVWCKHTACFYSACLS